MAKRNNQTKTQAAASVVQSGPAVRVEYPREDEVITQPTYTFQIGANPDASGVEISVDGGDWRPCRESLGLWWHDWADYPKGQHVLVARTRLGEGIVSTSLRRRFTVA